jgi:hypothetical protein
VVEVVIPLGETEPIHTHLWPGLMPVDLAARVRYDDENVESVPFHAMRVELKR